MDADAHVACVTAAPVRSVSPRASCLADRRPAIIGSDSWALEVLGNPVVQAAFPVHQDLLVRHGIRIGEGIVTDELAADRVHEYVYVTTPQYAKGATAGNAPPAALGQPGRGQGWGNRPAPPSRRWSGLRRRGFSSWR